MKVIQKLHQMNLTDMLRDISEVIENKETDWQCLCRIIWDKVLGLPHDKFSVCHDVEFPFIPEDLCVCKVCHKKCLERLMEKDI